MTKKGQKSQKKHRGDALKNYLKNGGDRLRPRGAGVIFGGLSVITEFVTKMSPGPILANLGDRPNFLSVVNL